MESNIDKVKEFWNKRPCNIYHSDKIIGTKEYFEEVTKKKFFVEPHILPFSEFPKWKDKEVLEIGCGIGTMMQEFIKNGAKYTGIELSNISLDICKRRLNTFGMSGNLYLGNAEELDSILSVKKFDLIYSFGVLHHSPNPVLILEQVKKYMNNNSLLKIMLYCSNSWKNFMIEANLDQPESQSGCPIATMYSKQEAIDLLKGFRVIDMKQTHIFPYIVEEYKRNVYKKQAWFEYMPDDVFSVLENNLGWHLLINARLT